MHPNLAPADWKLAGNEPMTAKQRRMLNAVCGDLAAQVVWYGRHMDKDSWRHFIAAVILKQPMVPGMDLGDGERGFVVLQRSSKELTKAQAAEAITALIVLGDNPASQGLNRQRPVQWCDAVLLGMGFNPRDLNDAAAA